MKRHQLVVRLDESQMATVRSAAKLFNENIQQFIERSLLLRVQTGESPMVVDPFDLALKNLKTAKPMGKLGPRAGASIREGLQELADGKLRTVSAAEAGADLRAAVQAQQEKDASVGGKAAHLAA